MPFSEFVPTLAQAAGLLAVLVVGAGFVGLGGLIGGRGRSMEADLATGWAVVAGAATVIGVLGDLPLTAVAMAAGVVAMAALGRAAWRRQSPLPAGAWRALVLVLPMLLVTMAMLPSQWDEFATWLPNARYLVTHDALPGGGRPASDSVLPAYPYALPLVSYLASRLSGGFQAFAPAQFNLLLLAAYAVALARLLRHGMGGDDEAPLGWSLAGLGLLAATLLSPTFVPKLALTAYADTATAVVVAFAGLAGWRLVEAAREDRPLRPHALQLGALCVLLLVLKQVNLVLVLLLGGAVALTALRGRAGRWRTLAVVAAALLPALAVYLLWRGYVAQHLAGGEVSLRAAADWWTHLLPGILARMGHVATQKSGHFGLSLVITVVATVAFWRGPSTPFQRLALIAGIVFVGYNAFLAFAYIAAFSDYEARHIASFWRYNTHVGLLTQAAAMLGLAIVWRRHVAPLLAGGRGTRALAGLAALAVALPAVAPVALAGKLRFDIHPVKRHVRAVAADLAGLLGADAKLAVIDPRGTGFYVNYLTFHMARGRIVSGAVSAFAAADAEALGRALAPSNYAWVHTQSPGLAGIAGGLSPTASHLLVRDGETWRLVRSWPFAGYSDPAAIPE